MSAGPVARAVRGGVTRRRVQTFVIGLVLLISTGASVLALSLVVDSSAPFDKSFAAQRGAHLALVVDQSRATPADLAATHRLPGVTGAAGPFAEATVAAQLSGQSGPAGSLPPLTLAGRSAPGGPVDQVTLQSGHWAQGPGQMVLESNPSSDIQIGLPLGQKITVASAPGKPVLTVVGVATSVTNSASGWVTPGEVARLRAPGAPPTAQMLYRFRNSGHRRRHPRRHRGGQPGPAARLGARHRVLPDRQGVGDLQNRAVRAVPGRLRRDRPGHVGADRGQRGQRRRGIGLPPDRHPEEHRLHPGPGGGGLHRPGHRARPGRRAGWAGARRPAGADAAAPGGQRLRGRHAGRAGVGGRGRAARHARPGRDRRPAALDPGRPAERGAGHRGRPGAAAGARLRCAPAVRPAAAAPAGDDRAGRAVRPPGAYRDHAGRRAARGDRGDVRGRPEHLAEPGGGRAVARHGRAGAVVPQLAERLHVHPGAAAHGAGRRCGPSRAPCTT